MKSKETNHETCRLTLNFKHQTLSKSTLKTPKLHQFSTFFNYIRLASRNLVQKGQIVYKKDEEIFGGFDKGSTFASPITKFFNTKGR